MIEIEGLKTEISKTEISKMESYLNEHYFEDSEYHMGYSEALQSFKRLINEFETDKEEK